MNPVTALLGKLVAPVTGIVSEAVTDKDLAARLAHDIQMAMLTQGATELEAQMKVIVAEAQSESWLTRSWRPITMLALTACVVAHWLGFTPPNLDSQSIEGLLTLVQIGLGGYVVSRGAEKTAKAWKAQ